MDDSPEFQAGRELGYEGEPLPDVACPSARLGWQLGCIERELKTDAMMRKQRCRLQPDRAQGKQIWRGQLQVVSKIRFEPRDDARGGTENAKIGL